MFRLKKRTARYWKIVILLLMGCLLMTFACHDQFLYHQPIAKITKVTNSKPLTQVDEFQNKDQITYQKIQGIVLNGHYCGKKIHLKNSFTKTHATDQEFHKNRQVFVSQIVKSKNGLEGNIKNVKRDYVIVFLGWLVVTLLILLMNKDGLKTIFSVIINTFVFIFAIWIDQHVYGNAVIIVFSILTICFSAISLLIILGPNKKMLATFFSTIIGTLFSVLLGILILKITKNRGVFYESMQYVTQIPQTLFVAELMLGSLGAVMDECSDIIATLFELHSLNPMISRQQLFQAGKKVGNEIVGPLINVLFLVFMTGTFASSILYLKNNNSWGYTFNMNMSLGMVQSLISAIGIASVVPIVSMFGALLLGRKQVDE